MVTTALKVWVNAGITPQPSENINPVRLTNIVAILVICVSLLQLPTAFYFWDDTGWYELLIVLSTVILLTLVPILNTLKVHKSAKIFLILVYTLDIFLSCLLWKTNLNIQIKKEQISSHCTEKL